jgi:hypothetical protein
MQNIAIDYETYLIGDEEPIPRPVCLSYADQHESGLLVGTEQIEKYLKEILESDKLIIAHNVTFELLVTYYYFPNLRELVIKKLEHGEFFCTQLYQQLLDNLSKKELPDKSLAGLVNVYFEEDISESKKDPDAWRLRYSELDGVSKEDWPKEAIDYAINDSIWALKLHKKQLQINDKLRFKSHIQASFALNWMAARGIIIDKSRVKILDEELNGILQPNYEKLEQKDFMKRDKRNKLSKNVKTLREYIGEKYKNLKYTPKNDVQVSGEALDFYLLEQEDEVLELFRKIGVYEKAKTAFVARLKTVNEVIRTNYNAIMRTGRTSSRTSKTYPSVNIQQMPRALKNVTWDIRNCFVPRPGFKLVTIDYNNLELLSCAHQLYSYYGHSNMRDIINSGDSPTDLHSVFACELMSSDTHKHITYDEYVKHKKDEEYKPYRSKGKPVTLGVPGGMGFDTIRTQFNKEGIKLPYAELVKTPYESVARRLVKKYRDTYPSIRVKRTGIREWSLVVDEIVKLKKILFKLYPELETFLKTDHEKFVNGEFGWTKNDFGEWEKEPYYRYSTMGIKRDYCTYTAFCNAYLMQAPSAVGAKDVCWRAFKEFDESEEVYALAFIHDEIIWEIKDNENLIKNVDRCAEIMIDGMKNTLTSVRVAVEVEVKDYWSKDVSLWAKNYWKDYNSNELRFK